MIVASQPEERRRKDHDAVNLAAALAMRGRRTLLIDLDPQANNSTLLAPVDRSQHLRRYADQRANPAHIISPRRP
jgi:cellulose biosynthesis protein BcsQ